MSLEATANHITHLRSRINRDSCELLGDHQHFECGQVLMVGQLLREAGSGQCGHVAGFSRRAGTGQLLVHFPSPAPNTLTDGISLEWLVRRLNDDPGQAYEVLFTPHPNGNAVDSLAGATVYKIRRGSYVTRANDGTEVEHHTELSRAKRACTNMAWRWKQRIGEPVEAPPMASLPPALPDIEILAIVAEAHVHSLTPAAVALGH